MAALQEVVKNATILVICTPHQFVYGICKELREWVDQSAIAISLTKVPLSYPKLYIIQA